VVVLVYVTSYMSSVFVPEDILYALWLSRCGAAEVQETANRIVRRF
jgi:hypothetical protein